MAEFEPPAWYPMPVDGITLEREAPGIRWERWYLHSRGRANTSSGDGRLGREEPLDEDFDAFVYDPEDPVPTIDGGKHSSSGLASGTPDQSSIERRKDVMVYSSAPLDRDLQVTGPLKVHLFATTTARDTDFAANLTDVYPDGRSLNVAEGIVRARFWQSPLVADLVEPGEIREYVIDLASASNVFRQGHRIRLDITSSNFPKFERNMNTGNPVGEDTVSLPAAQTIFHQHDLPSYVDLPVISLDTTSQL